MARMRAGQREKEVMMPSARFADLDGASVLITGGGSGIGAALTEGFMRQGANVALDRKSTRLNSSHQIISYAVFCLKKKTGKQRGGREAVGRANAGAGQA